MTTHLSVARQIKRAATAVPAFVAEPQELIQQLAWRPLSLIRRQGSLSRQRTGLGEAKAVLICRLF
jgi:hypothetical protein